MWDQTGLPAMPTFSYIKYNWEAEHFKQFRFALLWQGQSKLSGLIQLGVMIVLSVTINPLAAVLAVFSLNLVWSIIMVDFYERRRETGTQDIYQSLTFGWPTAWWGWAAFPFKLLFIVFGLKEWMVTKLMLFTRRGWGRLPISAHKSQTMMVIIGLSLTGILSGHHQLNKAGYTGYSRRRWNRFGRLLNAPTRVFETFVISMLGIHVGII